MLHSDFADLDGRWKLLYSSNIMGVGRLSPLTLEDVYQVIDTAGNSVKNVVYATLSPPMFVETWGRFPIAAVAKGARTLHGKATFRVDFSLDHSFEISSMEFPAQVSYLSFFLVGSTVP
jgi:PAP_fibrillin